METKDILKHLQSFIQEKQNNVSNKEAIDYSALKSIREENVFLGDAPKYFFARIECNSTGVGESRFEGTKTQRTVARDYVTDERLFIDGHIEAGAKGLSLFYLQPGQTINYFSKDDIVKVAKEYGYQLHLQHFRDLNFLLTDHRLNRHTIKITQGPFSYPIRPIFAVINEKGEKITIGYIYEKDGEEYIIIEPEDPQKYEKDQKKRKIGCAIFILIGLFCPLALPILLLVWYVKYKKERMRG